MSDVLIAILSCRKNAFKREAQRRTWLPSLQADYRFFLGNGNKNLQSDGVLLNCPDDYDHLSCKIRLLCQWALKHGYKWVFKTDDDVYASPERLLSSGFRNYDYMGNLFKGYCSGGGHWLSERAMKIIAEAKTTSPPSDKWVGENLSVAGIRAEDSTAFTVVNITGRPGTVARDNNATIACQLTPEEIEAMHKAWLDAPLLDEIRGLWVGSRLSPLEQLSIQSFLRNGHPFILYTYEDVANVPEGTLIYDANEILPQSEFDYTKFSSLGAFSDFFRHKMLLEKGGWWVDVDTVCVRPFRFDTPYVFSSEATSTGTHTNSGNIKVPANSDIEKYIWGECLKVDPSSIKWGAVGPALVSRAVEKFGLQEYVQPPVVFCPVPWWDVKTLVDPSTDFKIEEETNAVHLWGEMWNRRQVDKTKFPTGSPYEILRRDAFQEYQDTIESEVKPMEMVTALLKTFLRDESLFHCVRTLKKQHPAMHIIVADDGYCSKDKEQKLLDLGVDRYIQLPWNRGLSEGRNILLDACQTPFALFGDDDFSFDAGSHLDRLRLLMAVSDIAAGRVLQKGEHGYVKRGEFLNFGGNLKEIDGKMYHVPLSGDVRLYHGVGYEKADLPLNFFIGRVDALKKIRWDDNLKVGFEHEDFFLRAKAAGLNVVICPEVVANHQEVNDVIMRGSSRSLQPASSGNLRSPRLSLSRPSPSGGAPMPLGRSARPRLRPLDSQPPGCSGGR